MNLKEPVLLAVLSKISISYCDSKNRIYFDRNGRKKAIRFELAILLMELFGVEVKEVSKREKQIINAFYGSANSVEWKNGESDYFTAEVARVLYKFSRVEKLYTGVYKYTKLI